VRRFAVAAAVVTCAAILPAAQMASGGQPTRLPTFAGCLKNKPQIRPRSIVVACGDGNFFITSIAWASWTSTTAVGAGTGHQNDCAPDCARGHFHLYRVSLRLYRPALCQNKWREFTRFAWRFLGPKPSTSTRTGTVKSPFYTGAGCG
jgi:hypothetical protein